MAGPSINTKIKLDGEKEYKAALSQIRGGLSELKSELALASEQFKGNENSVEALTAKHDILERTISTQKERIETLKNALESSASAYGEADERTSKWKTQLNYAQAELVKMERELKDNEEALDKASDEGDNYASALDKIKNALKKTKDEGSGVRGAFKNIKEEFANSEKTAQGLGDALTDIASKFGIQIPESAQNAAQALNGVNAGAALAVTGIGLLAAAVVKAEKAFIDMTKQSAAFADNILTLSAQTGLGTDALQEFQYAAELLDVSVDTLQGSMTKLTNNMQTAAESGSGAAYEAFQKLGVAVADADGNLRSAENVFYDAIDALGAVQNQTERDALAMDIFGKSAQDLNPLIIQGREALKDYAEEANDLGYVLDSKALKSLGAVDDAQQRLLKTQEAVKNQLSVEFAPYLEEFYGKSSSIIENLGAAVKKSGIVDAFGMLLNTFTDIIAPAGELADDTVPKLTNALRPLAQVIATIADAGNLIAGFAKVLFSWGYSNKMEGYGQMATALGLNYSYGSPSNIQKLKEQWQQQDVNAATEAAGYGMYYANGKWYSNYDSYLRDEYEKNPYGTFEYWKKMKGYNASGTDNFRGGWTWVGENGPELVSLPKGSQILNNQESRSVGGDVYYITIDAKNVKEFNDIVRIAQNVNFRSRME